MARNKISLFDGKKLDLDQMQGRLTAFERMEHPVTLRLSKPLAGNGYGKITVNGIEIPKGKEFEMEAMGFSMHCLTVPVGSVAREYDTEYTMEASGFIAEDGTPFPKTVMKFKTGKRAVKTEPYAYDAHDAVAMQAARECMVLLKNDNHALPLDPTATLNLFGRGQYVFYNTATGAGLIHPRWQASVHQAIAEHSTFSLNRDIAALYETHETVIPTAGQLAAAKAKSDTAVIIISRVSGEFADNRPDKNSYYLTDEERELLRTVSEAFEKTVVIINSGYPIEMKWAKDISVDAILYTGFAGMGASYALMEILDGRCSPSAKLPDTYPWDYYDCPSAYNFPNLKASDKQPGEKQFGVRIFYEEDIYVGYRYFDTFGKDAAFSFGHGLSYTDFDIAYSAPVWNGETVSVDAEVRNIGTVPGKEVVQLYIAAPDGKLEKPSRVLAAFEKTKELAPGESETLHLIAEKKTFASFDEEACAFVLEKGEYAVHCGSSLAAARAIGTFTLTGDETVETVHRIGAPVESFKRLTKSDPTVGDDTKIVPVEERIPTPAPRPAYAPQPLPEYKGKRITFPELLRHPSQAENFVAQMSDDELCKMNVCGGSNWYMPWQNGAAGKINRIAKYKFPLFTVSDGNTGVNIKKPNIGFPSSAGIAASFNKDLAYAVGKVIAEESKENGIQLNLGPAQNIHRNILNGRHPEYFSEDPYLSGTMAGMHGKGLEQNGVGCCYKHLFCNGSDSSRKASHSIVSERALREIYFKTFEIAKNIQKPSALMTSYNAVNGIYPAENADMLQTLIREEWGLKDTFIMTDWGTYDTVDAVEMVKAGNCWLTEGSGKYVKMLQKAVKEGRLSRAVLERNVLLQIRMLIKFL